MAPAHQDKGPLGGTLTALVTPLNHDLTLDLGALAAHCQWQLDCGVQGFVPCGTTGEAATLSAAERQQVVAKVAAVANGAAVVAGVGTPCTRTTLEHLRGARDAGATAALVVTPYYNRPSADGLVRHFACLAEADLLPLVVYNVPGRTGCDLRPAVLARLAGQARILGIKDATGELDRLHTTAHAAPHWRQLSGDDLSACAFMLMGGHGVMSVASNLAPATVAQMVRFAGDGNVFQARALHAQLRPLLVALAAASNPIPVKAALHYLQRTQDALRLPLWPLEAQLRPALHAALQALPAQTAVL